MSSKEVNFYDFFRQTTMQQGKRHLLTTSRAFTLVLVVIKKLIVDSVKVSTLAV